MEAISKNTFGSDTQAQIVAALLENPESMTVDQRAMVLNYIHGFSETLKDSEVIATKIITITEPGPITLALDKPSHYANGKYDSIIGITLRYLNSFPIGSKLKISLELIE